MNELSDEIIAAYVDGELADDEIAFVEMRLEADAKARAAVDRYRALREEIDAYYRPVLDEPAPARLQRLLTRPERHADMQSPRRAAPSVTRRRAPIWLTMSAMAASLCTGVFIGAVAMKPAGYQFTADGRYSAHAITTALETRPSGDSSGAIRLKDTYQNTAGEACRVFDVGDKTVIQALACRKDSGAWKIAALTPAPPEGAYLPADGERGAFGDLLSAYKKVSAEHERKLLAAAWAL